MNVYKSIGLKEAIEYANGNLSNAKVAQVTSEQEPPCAERPKWRTAVIHMLFAACTSVRVRYNYKCSMDTISFNLSLTLMRLVATPGAFFDIQRRIF